MPKEKESPGGVFIQLKKAGQLPKPTDDGLLDVLENIASKPLLKIDKKAGGGMVRGQGAAIRGTKFKGIF
jgi:hypothetical protein